MLEILDSLHMLMQNRSLKIFISTKRVTLKIHIPDEWHFFFLVCARDNLLIKYRNRCFFLIIRQDVKNENTKLFLRYIFDKN